MIKRPSNLLVNKARAMKWMKHTILASSRLHSPKSLCRFCLSAVAYRGQCALASIRFNRCVEHIAFLPVITLRRFKLPPLAKCVRSVALIKFNCGQALIVFTDIVRSCSGTPNESSGPSDQHPRFSIENCNSSHSFHLEER